MQKFRYIHAVLSYIEGHLSDSLKPESIAERHFVSMSQLYRDFYTCTGHSIKEYIRKRRISNACAKIKSSEMPLAIIAEESGYQTIQAFHKQFKNCVGMTPLEYKMKDSYFYFYPFALNEISLAVKVGMETIPACTTTPFYDSCLAGIEDKAIAALSGNFGRIFGRNGKQIGNRFCYEVLTEKPGESKTNLYATCVVNYDEAEIHDGWNYLYNTWLPASMFEESGDRYFEEYILQNGRPRKLKLYLPVIKRKAERHITITSEPEKTFIIVREKGYDAERKASEKVMAFLQRYHPLLIRYAHRFFVCAYDDAYACGIECGDVFSLPKDGCAEILHIPAGRYAVLPDDRLGDIHIGSSKIETWLMTNSIIHENEPIFAVYETVNGHYDISDIRMNLYKRLKNDKNG